MVKNALEHLDLNNTTWCPLWSIFWEIVGNTSTQCIASSIDLLPSPQVKTTTVVHRGATTTHLSSGQPGIVAAALLRPGRLSSPETGSGQTAIIETGVTLIAPFMVTLLHLNLGVTRGY